MPCTRVGNAIVCSRGRQVPPCAWCAVPSTKLCDGRAAHRHGTCDKPLCDAHAHHVAPNADYCPTCQEALKP